MFCRSPSSRPVILGKSILSWMGMALWMGSLWYLTGSQSLASNQPQTQTENLPMALEALPLNAPYPPQNPYSESKANLGRLLFFDPVLSSDQKVACATCHHPRYAWADGRSTPIGIGGAGLGPARTVHEPSSPPLPVPSRNTPSLLNVAFNGWINSGSSTSSTAPMFWDSRVQGLEAQVWAPLTTPGEMLHLNNPSPKVIPEMLRRIQSNAEYRRLFSDAFKQPEHMAVTEEHAAQAIASFERTLITPMSPFDRFMRGDKSAMNPEQQRGMQIFNDAGCTQCHGGAMLSDFKLHSIGVPAHASESHHEFRTPTLRNVTRTAPYMHDGSLRTLREVLTFYDNLSEAVSETLDGGDNTFSPRLDPLLKQLNLSPDDFPALEAFLSTLNDEPPPLTIPVQVPSGLPTAY